jgi:hypothetical protein
MLDKTLLFTTALQVILNPVLETKLFEIKMNNLQMH